MVLVRSLRFNVSLMPLKKAASAVNISDEFYCHQIGQEVGNEIFTRHQGEIDINQIQKSR